MSIKQGNSPSEHVTWKDTDTQEGAANQNKDDIYHLLSNRRRRYMLHYLLQNGGTASKREVSRQIAAWENDVNLEEVTPNLRKRVYISLHQTHIPKMRDRGILKQDPEGCELRLADNAQDLQVYLDNEENSELTWNLFYLGLVLISGPIVVLSALGVTSFSGIHTFVLVLGILGLFAVTRLMHTIGDKHYQLGSNGLPPELK